MISVLVQITIISLLHQVRRFCHPLPCPIKLFKIPIIPSIIITFPSSTTILLLILLMVIIGGQLSLSRCRSCWQVAPHLSQNPIASILHCSRSKCVRDDQNDWCKHKHKVTSIIVPLCVAPSPDVRKAVAFKTEIKGWPTVIKVSKYSKYGRIVDLLICYFTRFWETQMFLVFRRKSDRSTCVCLHRLP